MHGLRRAVWGPCDPLLSPQAGRPTGIGTHLSPFLAASLLSGSMHTKAVALTETSDANLVAQSLAGQREAFGQIVRRYQSLICSMAYSATGSIARSEDVGQEVFLSAWKQLRQLREPAHLKSWLCGIARNALNSDFRRSHREPTHGAESLEGLPDTASLEALPSERTINREEEAILWQSLERVPEAYREPLILYYREHQSIARVAAALDLSEDAVKQRLSRGRRLLQEQVWSFVEGALERTAPDQTFTLGVLSALPHLAIVASSGAAGGAAAIQAGAAGKVATSAGGIAALFGPFAGLFGAAIGTKLAIEATTSQREKKFVRKAWAAMWVGAALYCAVAYLGVRLAAPHRHAHPLLFVWGLTGSVFCYGAVQGLFCLWVGRTQCRIRSEDMREPSHLFHGRPSYEYRSRWSLLGLPLLHIRLGPDENGKALPAKGWMAVGQVAHGILFAAGARAIGLVSIGATAIGLFAWGGCGIGVLAFGGVSLGVAAAGGGAIGYVAYGGGAVGWQGAAGGAAVAHHFAQGWPALAEHANDRAAQDFMRTNAFFRHAERFTGIMIMLSWLLMAVPAYFIWRLKRRRRVVTSIATLGCALIAATAAHCAPVSLSALPAANSGRDSTPSATALLSPPLIPATSFDSGMIHVDKYGSGRQLIVLIPGMACGPWVWFDTIIRFAPRSTIYALTLPGFDACPSSSRRPLLANFSKDFWAMLSEQKITMPIVIGHSLGGTIAIALAEEHPERLAGIVAVDGLPVFPTLAYATSGERAAVAAQYSSAYASIDSSKKLVSEEAYMSSVGTIRPELIEPTAQLEARSDMKTAAAWMYEDLAIDLRPDLPKISIPFLEVMPYNPDDARPPMNNTQEQTLAFYSSLIAGAPKASVVAIAPSRHFVMLDKPAAFAEQVEHFLISVNQP